MPIPALRNISIRRKIVVITMLTSAAALIAASGALIVSDQLRFRSELSRDLNTVASITAENTTAAVSFSDTDAASETLRALRIKPSIEVACLYDLHGIFARYVRSGDASSCPAETGPDGISFHAGSLWVVDPILLQNKRIGTIFIQSDLQQLSDRLNEQVITSLLVLLGASALAFFLSSSLQSLISVPVRNLMHTMSAVSGRENYGLRAVKHGADELGALVDSFNLMLTQIQDRDAELRSAKGELELRVQERTEELVEQLQETRMAQEELEKVNIELLQSNKELDDFAYIASHDLKEPLRGIYSSSAFLLEDYAESLGDDAKTRLETLMRLAQRMESLIDALLHYSQLGRMELACENVDLNDVLRDVVDSLETRRSELDVEIRVPRRLPAEYCDRIGIGEIFQNLITNAMKYNDKAGKWVEIGYSQSDSGHIFYVRDNGIGISVKHRDSIFRIFKRLHGRDKFGGGTGAGLTIVRKLIERHNGMLWLDSTEGEGTVFFFTLSRTVRMS